MMSHADARKVVLEAWGQLYPKITPSLGTLQLIQGTGLGEGEYGAAWNNANNWGAVQPGAIKPTDPPGTTCPPGTTPGKDSTPLGGVYTACLKVYPTPLDGCVDMIRYMVKLSNKDGFPALLAGDNEALARAMYFANGYPTPAGKHRIGYYGGFHPNAKERAAGQSQVESDAKNVLDRVHWIQSLALKAGPRLTRTS